jgi:hypothetical protein
VPISSNNEFFIWCNRCRSIAPNIDNTDTTPLSDYELTAHSAVLRLDTDCNRAWISTNVTEFTAGGVPLNCHNPVLSPDSSWVAFKGEGSRIFRHHVDTATTTLVSSNAVTYGLMVEDLSGPDRAPHPEP